MTAAHIADIYFNGSYEAAKKRLQKIKAAGLITERRRLVIEPSILFLTRKAFILLKNKGFLSAYPPLALSTLEKRAAVSNRTIPHELEVMDMKAAFFTALAKLPKFSIEEFCTWPLLYDFFARRSAYGQKVLVKPDGHILIHENISDDECDEYAFFLEVDRSTEKLDTLVERAACYIDFYRSGG